VEQPFSFARAFPLRRPGRCGKNQSMSFAPKPIFALLLVTALAACGPADSDPGPGGVTAGDAKALDQAAQQLDERDKEADTDSLKE
jgi:hypothetical protein